MKTYKEADAVQLTSKINCPYLGVAVIPFSMGVANREDKVWEKMFICNATDQDQTLGCPCGQCDVYV